MDGELFKIVLVNQTLSKEDEDKRQIIFDNEKNRIAEKYISLGYNFIREYRFNEVIKLNTGHRKLFSFDEEFNLPFEMQNELGDAWIKRYL